MHKKANQSKQHRKKLERVGASKELMIKLKGYGFDQRQLTTEELIELRFKNWNICYIEGIPTNDCTKYELAKKFGVYPSQIYIKVRDNYNMNDYFGCCYIHYNDSKRCKKMVKEIKSNKHNYDNEWKIRANYGLFKYCEQWAYDNYCKYGKNCRDKHAFYCNFEKKQIHTKDMEEKLKSLPCGPNTAKHYDHDTYNNGKAPSDSINYAHAPKYNMVDNNKKVQLSKPRQSHNNNNNNNNNNDNKNKRKKTNRR